MPNPLAADLDHVLLHTRDLWEELRGKRIFITGGTGFFGHWLLESFVWANEALRLNATACVLTRRPEAFTGKSLAGKSWIANSCVRLWRGDFTDFEYPEGSFYAVIHAATAHTDIYDANIAGTRRVLEFTRACGASRFLFTSSGAVYGRQPPGVTHIPEEYEGAPDTMDPGTAYAQSKRAAEFLCASKAREHGFAAGIARCFAFSGPYLPLDLNFAIGNFVRDALAGGPIRVGGDGTPYRSYLYAADLAIWLWTILLRGESCRPYNIGSGEEVQIAELAQQIRKSVNPEAVVQIARKPIPGEPASRYVPSVRRAGKELGLHVWIPLEEGIKRMADWRRAGYA